MISQCKYNTENKGGFGHWFLPGVKAQADADRPS